MIERPLPHRLGRARRRCDPGVAIDPDPGRDSVRLSPARYRMGRRSRPVPRGLEARIQDAWREILGRAKNGVAPRPSGVRTGAREAVSEVTISVGMRVFDQNVEMEMTLPQVPPPRTLLPVFRRVSDSLVELSAGGGAAGRTISCAKGAAPVAARSSPRGGGRPAVARLVDELPSRAGACQGAICPREGETREAGLLSRLQDCRSSRPTK